MGNVSEGDEGSNQMVTSERLRALKTLSPVPSLWSELVSVCVNKLLSSATLKDSGSGIRLF